MEFTMEQVASLLPEDIMSVWIELTAKIDSLYDVDRLWNKGFGAWKTEYKYRRGGKTLCAFYAKENEAVLLITYGKAERDKFEGIRPSLSKHLQDIFDQTETLHDGKWLWLPLDNRLNTDDVIEMLKIKRRPNKK